MEKMSPEKTGHVTRRMGLGANIYNNSHALDTTAKEAVDSADKFMFRDKKAMEFVGLLNRMAKAAGYRITEKIVFTDLRTGKEYK